MTAFSVSGSLTMSMKLKGLLTDFFEDIVNGDDPFNMP